MKHYQYFLNQSCLINNPNPMFLEFANIMKKYTNVQLFTVIFYVWYNLIRSMYLCV